MSISLNTFFCTTVDQSHSLRQVIQNHSLHHLKPGLHVERKSTAHTQTIVRTWGAFSRPPMPIYAVGIAQVPSVNTPTIRRLLRVDAGLSMVNSLQPMHRPIGSFHVKSSGDFHGPPQILLKFGTLVGIV